MAIALFGYRSKAGVFMALAGKGKTMESNKLGQQVAQLATQLKVKQTRIAQDCEISRISVNRFFRGRSEIRATDLVNVLKVLGIDLQSEIERRLSPPQA